jgi:hypothetical protein
MTKQEWLAAAKTAIKRYTELKSLCAKAYDIGALEEEGPMDTAIWSAFDNMLDVWDKEGWVDWFIYNNRCGKRKSTVRYNGKEHTIHRITQLAEYLDLKQFFTPETP